MITKAKYLEEVKFFNESYDAFTINDEDTLIRATEVWNISDSLINSLKRDLKKESSENYYYKKYLKHIIKKNDELAMYIINCDYTKNYCNVKVIPNGTINKLYF